MTYAAAIPTISAFPAATGRFQTTGLGMVLYRDVLTTDYHPSAADLKLHDAIGAHSETTGFDAAA